MTKRRLVLFALVVATPAWAYVPSSQYLLQRYVQGRAAAGLETLRVEQKTTLVQADREQVFSERIWYQAPWRLRQERDESGQVSLTVRDGEQLASGALGRALKKRKEPLDFWTLFFSSAMEAEPPTSERVVAYLQARGVDLERRALTRFDGRIAVLIGADPWSPQLPQLWLAKDGGYPLRFIYRDGVGEQAPLVDIRLRGYGGAKTGAWYPEVIEVYRAGQLVQRTVVDKVEVKPELPADHFKLP